MDRNVQRLDVLSGGGAYGVDTHKVLRNTFWLLSLSMLPTIARRMDRRDRPTC